MCVRLYDEIKEIKLLCYLLYIKKLRLEKNITRNQPQTGKNYTKSIKKEKNTKTQLT